MEQLASFQAALTEWFLEVAQARPLLLLVDNLHAADESSAALLSTLASRARDAQLLIAGAQRTGDTSAAQPARLRGRADQLELGPLSESGCLELVQALFGDVDNSQRLATNARPCASAGHYALVSGLEHRTY